jgi:hypothetical protein
MLQQKQYILQDELLTTKYRHFNLSNVTIKMNKLTDFTGQYSLSLQKINHSRNSLLLPSPPPQKHLLRPYQEPIQCDYNPHI